MSKVTKRINQITTGIIMIAVRVVIIAVIIVITAKGIRIAYDFGHSIFYEEAVEEAPGHDVTVTIPEDASAKDVGTLLLNKGLIKNKYSIIVQTKFFDYEIVPGTYIFYTSQSSRAMLKMINEAKPEEGEETKD